MNPSDVIGAVPIALWLILFGYICLHNPGDDGL